MVGRNLARIDAGSLDRIDGAENMIDRGAIVGPQQDLGTRPPDRSS